MKESDSEKEMLKETDSENEIAQVWADRVNKECCSPYYSVLVKTEDAERVRPRFFKP